MLFERTLLIRRTNPVTSWTLLEMKTVSRPVILLILAPVAVLVLMIVVWNWKPVQQVENVTVDWRFEARADRDPAADERILIVGIDEESLADERLGRWPWPRTAHAQLLNSANKKKPNVVVFDLLFTEPSSDGEQDDLFAQEMELYPNVIIGAAAEADARIFGSDAIGKTEPFSKVVGDIKQVVGDDLGIVPIEKFATTAWTGFVNSDPSEVDGLRWRIPLVVRFGKHLFPSLALQAVMRTENVRTGEVDVILGECIRFSDADGKVIREIPIDETGQLRLNYRSQDSLTQVGYLDLLERLAGLRPWVENYPPIEGQTLFIGQTASGLSDFGPTPLSTNTPLVVVQATAVNNMLQEDYLRIAPRWPILAVWLLVTWGTLWWLRNSAVSIGVAVPIVLGVGYVALAFWLFEKSSLQFPVFLPTAGFLGLHMLAVTDRLFRENKAKGRIKNMFGTYVSPEVVDEMVNAEESPQLGGQNLEITAFFSDIQSFSKFSEELDPQKLVALLNEYLGPFTDILTENGGTLDKYIGDAIVAMFGAPMTLENHAYLGCRTAIEMQQRQAALRKKWRQDGDWSESVYRMQTRIGLNTGEAVIGNMGSPTRFNYTMMGDTVNLAARMESGAKQFGVYSMITESTQLQSVASKDDVVFRFLDQIVVKGRTKPTKIFEVVGFKSEITQETADCIGIFSEGMEKYQALDWAGARTLFEKSAELELFQPEDESLEIMTNPSLLMAGRCPQMQSSPPGDDWDGVYTMTSK